MKQTEGQAALDTQEFNMEIIERHSPHFRTTRKAEVDTLVIHYISAINVMKNDPFNVEQCLKFLTEPIPIGNGKSVKVSAHYMVDREGKIYRLVKEENVSWHAGKSELHGSRSIRNSCNDFSIGIEMIGGAWIHFTDAQYDSLIELTKDIQTRYDIPKENIVGHEDIAPGRKTDPGKKFNWDKYLTGVYKKPEDKTPPPPPEPKDEEVVYPAEEMTNNISDGKERNPLVHAILTLILKIFNLR